MKHENISPDEFERRFDDGESIDAHVDWSKTDRPNRKLQKVNIDFPVWMVKSLDRKADHLGISRQALVKMWIAQCLEHGVCSDRQV